MMNSVLSLGLLIAATGATSANAARILEPLRETCHLYGINTAARLAAFLAQVGHESGSFAHLREIWGPTPAQQRYEGRADLGNVQPGDGSRYRGRGLIQVTGRFNYRAATARLRALMGDAVPDFEQQPEALELPRWACLSAGDYWHQHRLNALADSGSADDFERITRRINGGLNGQDDRLRRWRRAREALAQAYASPAQPAPAPEPQQPPAAAPTPSAPQPAQKGTPMAAPAIPIIKALLPSLVQYLPRLGRMFGSGSAVAERNLEAAQIALQVVQSATGARNAQEAVETIASDPEARQRAADAIDAEWLHIGEAGGGGIHGARQADRAAAAAGNWWRSPSFVVALALLPLVYMVLVSVLFGVGPDWPSDVRAAIATAIVSLIVGGLMGYYFGQTTSRNRTPAGMQES
jgi:putative chitinase